MVRRAAVLHHQGFGVLLFDMQAQGESPGRFITLGWLERLDAQAAVDEVHRRLPEERVTAIGVSLGGAALALAARELRVDGLVLEAVFPTLDAALSNRLESVFPAAVVPVLGWALKQMMPPILGVDAAAVRPIAGVAAFTAPVMILSGEEDPRTPIAEARMLFDAVSTRKQFWAVPGAGHVDLEQADTPAYWAHVMPFLQAVLQPGLR